jgi:hypothetical protein
MDADSAPSLALAADPSRELAHLLAVAWRVVVSIRVAECAIVGASAGCVTIGAAVASGAAEASTQARAIAALVALLAALMWWIERRPDVGAVARRIDRAEDRSGELVTAFEIAARRAHNARPTEVGDLLAARAASSLSLARCLRAAAPSSVALLALPCAAVAVLALAIDVSRDGVSRDGADEVEVESAAASLAAEAQHVRAASARIAARGASAADAAAEMRALANDAERMRRDLLAKSMTPSQAAAELASNEARVRALVDRELADRSVAADLDAALGAIRAARDDFARADGASSRSRAAAVSAGAEGASDRGADASVAAAPPPVSSPGDVRGGGERSRDADARAATRAEDHAVSRSSSPVDSPRDGSPAESANPIRTDERGLDAGRWWPSRYDGVVERWVESQRDARATPSHDR